MTTGILVFSGTVPVHVTIRDNRIFNDHYGVWLGINGNVAPHSTTTCSSTSKRRCSPARNAMGTRGIR